MSHVVSHMQTLVLTTYTQGFKGEELCGEDSSEGEQNAGDMKWVKDQQKRKC